jgi:transcriptional regulator with XRE-family HTH domain
VLTRKSRSSQYFYKQEQLGRLLREARLVAGLRQVDLASRLGMPQSYVSKFESGERSLTVLELISICKVLDISLVDLVKQLELELDISE